MRNIMLGTAIALTLASFTQVRADEVDKKTRITVNETILIPGRTLPPGKYVIKLLRSASNRNIVQIFNDDENKLQATILAINNYRLQPTDKTVLQYWETPSGSPPALRAWFSAGDQYGQEFAYPRKMAETLARENNNAKVPFYNATSNAEPGPNDLAAIDVGETSGVDDTASPAAVRTSTPTPARETLLAQVERPSQQSETLLAQNQPTSTTPRNADEELPQTAGSLGWVLAIGIVSLLAATGVRLASRSS
ncbi:MAG: hypothetical protein ABIR70_15460 [Bryobacteraceae bacterium]